MTRLWGRRVSSRSYLGYNIYMGVKFNRIISFPPIYIMSGKETQSPSSGDAATSHVDVNYFNPDGDEGLRRTISRMSAATQEIEQTGSSETLNAFDLRKVLEQVAEQYVDLSLGLESCSLIFS